MTIEINTLWKRKIGSYVGCYEVTDYDGTTVWYIIRGIKHTYHYDAFDWQRDFRQLSDDEVLEECPRI
jgi:hypothetical protein